MANRNLQDLYAGRAEDYLGKRVESIWTANERPEVLRLVGTAKSQCVVITDMGGIDVFSFLRELPAGTDLVIIRAAGEASPQQDVAREVEVSGEFDDWLETFRKLTD